MKHHELKAKYLGGGHVGYNAVDRPLNAVGLKRGTNIGEIRAVGSYSQAPLSLHSSKGIYVVETYLIGASAVASADEHLKAFAFVLLGLLEVVEDAVAVIVCPYYHTKLIQDLLDNSYLELVTGMNTRKVLLDGFQHLLAGVLTAHNVGAVAVASGVNGAIPECQNGPTLHMG